MLMAEPPVTFVVPAMLALPLTNSVEPFVRFKVPMPMAPLPKPSVEFDVLTWRSR